jgi:hypothetical protein
MADNKHFSSEGRNHATDDHSPHAHRRWTDVLMHRWPTALGIAVAALTASGCSTAPTPVTSGWLFPGQAKTSCCPTRSSPRMAASLRGRARRRRSSSHRRKGWMCSWICRASRWEKG